MVAHPHIPARPFTRGAPITKMFTWRLRSEDPRGRRALRRRAVHSARPGGDPRPKHSRSGVRTEILAIGTGVRILEPLLGVRSHLPLRLAELGIPELHKAPPKEVLENGVTCTGLSRSTGRAWTPSNTVLRGGEPKKGHVILPHPASVYQILLMPKQTKSLHQAPPFTMSRNPMSEELSVKSSP